MGQEANVSTNRDESTQPPARSMRRTLALHVFAWIFRGTIASVALTLPFLARKQFNADETIFLIIVSCMNLMQFFTIFWNRLYQRISTARYLITVGLIIGLPLMAMGLFTTLVPLTICWVMAAFGGAAGGVAFSPLNGDLLRNCYTENIRGRAYAVIAIAQFVGVIIGGAIMGWFSNDDPFAYRYIYPCFAVSFIITLVILYRILPKRPAQAATAISLPMLRRTLWEPIADLRSLLIEDRHFRNYEISFMSYGVGWMVVSALLALICNDRLGLDYREFSASTIIFFQAAMILLLFPAGIIADRFGPVRLASGAFGWLTIYPLFLIAVALKFDASDSSASTVWLSVASIIYAIGMVGVHLTWSLGPVSFANNPSEGSRYLAVHGTLVGVRAILFQSMAIALYKLTGSFTIPLALGAAGFLFASFWMHRLGKAMRATNSR